MTQPLVVLWAAALLGASAATPPQRDYATLDVCKLVPAEQIASAFGGTVERPSRRHTDKSFSRCTYFVLMPGGGKTPGYEVWIQPPEDFDELKKYIEEPLTAVSGLGDGAYLFQDKGDGRFKINVLERGDLMFQATGESAESARKVANAVVAVLWKQAA